MEVGVPDLQQGVAPAPPWLFQAHPGAGCGPGAGRVPGREREMLLTGVLPGSSEVLDLPADLDQTLVVWAGRSPSLPVSLCSGAVWFPAS